MRDLLGGRLSREGREIEQIGVFARRCGSRGSAGATLSRSGHGERKRGYGRETECELHAATPKAEPTQA